ncbi:MAG: glucosaminidase domain-containing protein [Campylobacterota bacterium]|nr:glucosaminidase domain-containing protein [Campylobacterota bacterium]
MKPILNYKNYIFTTFLCFITFTGCDYFEEEKVIKPDNKIEEKKVEEKEQDEIKVNIPKPKDINITDKNLSIISTVAPKKEIELKKDFISVSEKKQYFKDTLIPLVVEVYIRLQIQYQVIQKDIILNQNQELIKKLMAKYKVDNRKRLLEALKPHPISITLAQAATESAWLTSRFVHEGKNIFGVWSFNKNEPRIQALDSRGSKVIYLKKYKTLKKSIEDYYYILATNKAYKDFRQMRVVTYNPYVLIPYLKYYSEKREEYTDILKSVLEYNKFTKYDIK